MVSSVVLDKVKAYAVALLDGKDPDSMCYEISKPLYSLLNHLGVGCEITSGYLALDGHGDYMPHHYWLTLADGNIIDATASQFKDDNGGDMPEFYYGIMPEWYIPERDHKAGCKGLQIHINYILQDT